MARGKYKIHFLPIQAAVVAVAGAVDEVEAVMMRTQHCCENHLDWALTWFLAGQSNPPFLLSFGLMCVSGKSLLVTLVSCTPVSMLLSPSVWELLPLQGPDRDCSHARHCTDCPSAGARDVSRHRSQVWTPGSGHWLLFSGSPAKLKMFCCHWKSSTRSFIESVI